MLACFPSPDTRAPKKKRAIMVGKTLRVARVAMIFIDDTTTTTEVLRIRFNLTTGSANTVQTVVRALRRESCPGQYITDSLLYNSQVFLLSWPKSSAVLQMVGVHIIGVSSEIIFVSIVFECGKSEFLSNKSPNVGAGNNLLHSRGLHIVV